MKSKFGILVAAAMVVGSAVAAQAQGASDRSPGHMMQEKGSKKGEPGASGYAPGQRMQDKGSVKGTTGASGYAPGHTTGSGTKSDDKPRR